MTLDDLRKRRSAIDSIAVPATHSDAVDARIARLVDVISEVVPSGQRYSYALAMEPELVDQVIAMSDALRDLGREMPEVTHGPLATSRQFWIATGRPDYLSPPVRMLDESYFDTELGAGVATTKPFNFGLYTSTGVSDGFGMWHSYLELHRGSTLFPLPWTIWLLKAPATVRVREIASAVDWVTFVSDYPLRKDGLLYPDWGIARRRYDAIHVTLSAVVAIQGIALRAGDDVVAPAFWDVESTLWLRWVFEARELVASVNEGRP